ncbi:MAG: DUF3575 domain-containing protein [Lewinellaceae bacterium]|nr:DUF3575 domain-containing protein [Lewinellaceae bacterium]
MPRILAFFFFCLILLPAMQAQSRTRFRPAARETTPEHRFSAGIAPFSLLLPSGKVNLKGEFAYADNKSIALLVAVPRPTTVPGFLANDLDLSDDGETVTNRFTSFGAIIEHRFYLGHNVLRGFYFAPYARYNNMSVQRTIKNQYETSVKGSVAGFGLGASAGLQIRLGDFLTLDATVVGVDFKWLDGTLTYSSDNPDTDLVAFRDQVQDAVGGIPVIGSKLAAQIDGNSIKVHTPGLLMPGYRFNLTMNYLF